MRTAPLGRASGGSCCDKHKECGQELMHVISGAIAAKYGQSPAKFHPVPICDNAPGISKPIKPVAPANWLC